ncbi:MAG: hypothetical protein AAF845_09460 [Bacteroidota bacterium]
MHRFALLLAAVLTVAACDATNEVPGVGQAGPALAVDSVRVSVSGVETITVGGITGGSPTASDTLRLDAGTAYSGVVRAVDDAQDTEIQAEAESYLFTFAVAPGGATVTQTDRESVYAVENLNDGDYPLGRTFRIEVDDAASGAATLTVSLVRYDGAPKSDLTGTGGMVDFSVSVPIFFAADES